MCYIYIAYVLDPAGWPHCVPAGTTLAVILQAGQWKSPAFMQYLDKSQLETDAVLQRCLVESGDEYEDIDDA